MISERWQQEVAETVYEAVNCDTDKNEARKRAKNKQLGHEEGKSPAHSATCCAGGVACPHQLAAVGTEGKLLQ